MRDEGVISIMKSFLEIGKFRRNIELESAIQKSSSRISPIWFSKFRGRKYLYGVKARKTDSTNDTCLVISVTLS